MLVQVIMRMMMQAIGDGGVYDMKWIWSFFKLSPRWGINRGRTSHYFQFVQHQFWVIFFVLIFAFIRYQNKVLFESSFSIYCVLALCFCVSSFELDLGSHFLWFVFFAMSLVYFYFCSFLCPWHFMFINSDI